MDPYFVRPRAATVTAATEASTAPASNLLLDEPGLVWRSPDLTTPNFVIDAGVAVEADCLALLFTNLRATDTIRWRGAATSGGLTSAPGYDSTAVAAFTGTASARLSKHIHTPETPQVFRWWRADISAPSHPDGYVQASRLIIGKRVSIGADFDSRAVQTLSDPSVVDEGPGFEDIEEFDALPGWRVTFSWISETVWRQTWWPFCVSIGMKKRVLFVPQPELPDNLQDTAVFGRFRDRIDGEHPMHDGWQQEISIVSIAP